MIEKVIMQGIQSLYQEGIWGDILDNLFEIFTFLGEETIVLVALFIVYWAVNKKVGELLLFNLFITVGLNCSIKGAVKRVRPFEAFPDDFRYVRINNYFVDTVSLRGTYSFPSGHAQIAGSLYSSIAMAIRTKKAWIIAIIIIVLVMLSRVYLGVHYPSDVLVGALLGVGVGIGGSILFKKLYKYKTLLFAMVAFFMLISFIIFPTNNMAKIVGAGIGFVLAIFIENKYIKFEVKGKLWKRVLRVLIGTLIIFGLRLALRAVFADENIYHIIRYSIISFVGGAVWPYIFVKLNL